MGHHTDLVQSIRDAGHRLTPQREGVLAVIADTHGHITAEAILARVRERYPFLNKSAVYRNLELLTQLGLISVIDLGHGHVEYELQQHPPHHHLICRHCKGVKQIDHSAFTALERKIQNEFEFTPDLDHFAIFGTCAKCKTRLAKAQSEITTRKP